MRTKLQTVLVFFFIIYTKTVSGLSSDTATLFTDYYSADSSRIHLIAKFNVSTSPCYRYSLNVFDSLNSIELVACYKGQNLLSICSITDTIDLGIRENGLIHITAILQQFYNNQCVSNYFRKDTFDFTIDLRNTDIPQIDFSSGKLSLYPNPATDQLIIRTANSIQDAAITISTVTGTVAKQAILTNPNKNEIDINKLPAGLYFLCLQDERGRVVRRFVKQ